MTRVYYFTRTGDSEKIAASIAEQTGGTRLQIGDDRSWAGAAGFLRACRWAAGRRKLPAIYEKPREGDTIYLCFPVWAGSFPPAVRTFVEEVGRGKIIAVPSSWRGRLADRNGFARVIEVIGPNKAVKL